MPSVVPCAAYRKPDFQASIYWDSIELFFFRRYLTVEQLAELEHVGQVKQSMDHLRRLWGWRLILRHPTKRVLRQADRLQHAYRGVVNRVDIACDNRPELADTIRLQAWLRWRRRGWMGRSGDGTYWSDLIPGKRPPSRNLVLYDDRVSKVTGHRCAHLELRFYGADTIRRLDIYRVSDLFGINPRDLFNKHVAWADAGDKHIWDTIRKSLKHERLHQRTEEASDFVDRYRSSLAPRFYHQIVDRLHFNRAQVFKDRFPNRKLNVISPAINIPTILSWPGNTHYRVNDPSHPPPYKKPNSFSPTSQKPQKHSKPSNSVASPVEHFR
jgi:hypothetical protein